MMFTMGDTPPFLGHMTTLTTLPTSSAAVPPLVLRVVPDAETSSSAGSGGLSVIPVARLATSQHSPPIPYVAEIVQICRCPGCKSISILGTQWTTTRQLVSVLLIWIVCNWQYMCFLGMLHGKYAFTTM